jgi:hypothetical protein
MNNDIVHDRKSRIRKARKYLGEAEGAGLLHWLNAKNPSDKKQLAKAYVEEVMTLIQSLPKGARGEKKPEGAGKIQTQLIGAFNKYELVRTCDYDTSSGDWIYPFRPTHDFSGDWVRGEADSIERIVKLAEMGVLAQVRKCACGEYFFARFPNRDPKQRFHSSACREKFWEASPERRELKRKRAKEYYHLHATGKVK